MFLVLGVTFLTTPLEVTAVCFYWPPLEVGVRYCSGAACLGMRGAFDFLCGIDFIVFPFVNIALTSSIADNCESQILSGTYLSAAVKKCIACVILSSALM